MRGTSGTGQAGDFDFMFGEWNVRHCRLRARLAGCADWDSFDGNSTTRPILGGTGNIEDNLIDLPGDRYRALAMRSFAADTGTWAIWWLDARAPHRLDPPVVGGFAGDTGTFLAEDSLDGRPITVRFQWHRAARPRWEQAFSPDSGRTWETNWIMEFTRAWT